MSTSIKATLGAAALALLVTTGCTPASPDERVEALDALRTAMGSGYVANFSVDGDWRVQVVTGRQPSERQRVYPTEQAPLEDTAQPITVPSTEFPLDASIEFAESQLEQCDGHASVTVEALSPGITTATSRCDDATLTFLDGEQLEPLTSPLSGTLLHQVWSEIERAGLSEKVQRVSIDMEAGDLKVILLGPDRGRHYLWHREFDATRSAVSSTARLGGTTSLNPPPLPNVDVVGATVDKLLGSLSNPEEATRLEIELEIQPGADEPRVVLEAADYTELASADLPIS